MVREVAKCSRAFDACALKGGLQSGVLWAPRRGPTIPELLRQDGNTVGASNDDCPNVRFTPWLDGTSSRVMDLKANPYGSMGYWFWDQIWLADA